MVGLGERKIRILFGIALFVGRGRGEDAWGGGGLRKLFEMCLELVCVDEYMDTQPLQYSSLSYSVLDFKPPFAIRLPIWL